MPRPCCLLLLALSPRTHHQQHCSRASGFCRSISLHEAFAFLMLIVHLRTSHSSIFWFVVIYVLCLASPSFNLYRHPPTPKPRPQGPTLKYQNSTLNQTPQGGKPKAHTGPPKKKKRSVPRFVCKATQTCARPAPRLPLSDSPPSLSPTPTYKQHRTLPKHTIPPNTPKK